MGMREQYRESGVVVVDDFLPAAAAEELHELYAAAADWEEHDQVREHHFEHVCYTRSPYFPGTDECYRARFGRSHALEAEARVRALFDEHFKPTLRRASGVDLRYFDFRCYRLKAGDFYRTHIDDWAGDIGCIYYVNKRWSWDWGGILHVGLDDGTEGLTPIFPKFNRAVLVDHGRFRFPHFISPVTDYALNPRFTLVSFNAVDEAVLRPRGRGADAPAAAPAPA